MGRMEAQNTCFYVLTTENSKHSCWVCHESRSVSVYKSQNLKIKRIFGGKKKPEPVGWLVGSLLVQSASLQSNVGAETFMWNSMTSVNWVFPQICNYSPRSRCLSSLLFSFPILRTDRRPVCDYAPRSLAAKPRSSLARLVILGARPRKRGVKNHIIGWVTDRNGGAEPRELRR